MANILKVVIFLTVIAGIIIYFLAQGPIWLSGSPREKIKTPPRTQSYTPLYPYSGINNQPNSALSRPKTEIPAKTEIPDYLIPQGFTREQLSPYFQKINISSVSVSWGENYPSEISLSASLSENEKINITGWRLKSNRGEIIIPQAVNIYEASGLSPQEDIVLLSGYQYVKIYSNFSPIARNLRLNKCLGYLENFYDFNPNLPQNCPYVSRAEIAHLSGRCQSYILSLGSCKLPEASFYNWLPATTEGALCRDFLNTINYSSCLQKYRRDANFLSNEWRIWAGQNILDPQHDTVKLFDKQGLLVDQYIY